MIKQWKELKETITELRDSDGTGTQQEVCKFLANYMEILEKQMVEPKIGHWIKENPPMVERYPFCSECGFVNPFENILNYCPNCGCRMVEPQERSEE